MRTTQTKDGTVFISEDTMVTQVQTKFPQPGTPDWLAAKASGPKWSYQDARGIDHIGYMERFSDHGGTDVTYWFRDATTGDLTLCSGSRLKAAKRI
jgi:hypothetical protein